MRPERQHLKKGADSFIAQNGSECCRSGCICTPVTAETGSASTPRRESSISGWKLRFSPLLDTRERSFYHGLLCLETFLDVMATAEWHREESPQLKERTEYNESLAPPRRRPGETRMSRTPPPIQAKQAEPSGSGISPPDLPARILPPKARPKDVFERLAQLIADGRIGAARRLIAEAVRCFPDHRRIRLAERVLNGGEATPDSYAQPTAAAESEWLDNPPDDARGKWVALIGSELVGMADSVDELMQSLGAKQLKRIPLVHHLAT